MHHRHIDRFALIESPVHHMDAGVKLLAALAFILLVVLTPDGYFTAFAVYAALIWTVILLSRVPPSYILIRSLTLLPFVLFVSVFVPFITPGNPVAVISLGPFHPAMTREGTVQFASILFRAAVAFFTVTCLASTTRFSTIMQALERFGAPAGLVSVLSFMYRYLFILVDDASHMMLARNLRSSGKGGLSVLRASGGIVGSLLARSIEHADRLYAAMMLRGHSGRTISFEHAHTHMIDIVGAVLFLALAALGLAVDRFGMG